MAEEDLSSGMQAFEIQEAVQGRPVKRQDNRAMLQCGIAACIVIMLIVVTLVWMLAVHKAGTLTEWIPEFYTVLEVYNFVRDIETQCLHPSDKQGPPLTSLQLQVTQQIQTLEVSDFMFVTVTVDDKRPISVRTTGGKHKFRENILELSGVQDQGYCAEVVLHKPLHGLVVSSSSKVKIRGGMMSRATVTANAIAYIDHWTGKDASNFVSVNTQGTCAIGLVSVGAHIEGNVNREQNTKLLVGENHGVIKKEHGGDLIVERGISAVAEMKGAGETDMSEQLQLSIQRNMKRVEDAQSYLERLFKQCNNERPISNDLLKETIRNVVLSEFMLVKVKVDGEAEPEVKMNGGTAHVVDNTLELTGQQARLFCATVTVKEPLHRVSTSGGAKIKVEGGLEHSASAHSNSMIFIDKWIGSADRDYVSINSQGVVVIELVPDGKQLLATVEHEPGNKIIVGDNKGVIRTESQHVFVQRGLGAMAAYTHATEQDVDEEVAGQVSDSGSDAPTDESKNQETSE